MLEEIWYFFEDFWSPMNTAGFTDGVNFTIGLDNQIFSLTQYLTMLSTIAVGILIVIAMITFVIWVFKFFAGLVRR